MWDCHRDLIFAQVYLKLLEKDSILLRLTLTLTLHTLVLLMLNLNIHSMFLLIFLAPVRFLLLGFFHLDFCRGKLVEPKHFAASIISRSMFNLAKEYASPFDGDSHGTPTASSKDGHHKISFVAEPYFGHATGMISGAHIAVSKVCWLSTCYYPDIMAALDVAINKDPTTLSFVNEAPWIAPLGASTLNMKLTAIAQCHVPACLFLTICCDKFKQWDPGVHETKFLEACHTHTTTLRTRLISKNGAMIRIIKPIWNRLNS